MDMARNDLSTPVAKFCLALEELRRTPEGRVRTSQELVSSFFPHDEKSSEDRIFKHLPAEARGPIIAAWGIRGIKAALRDSDDKVQAVVHDALVAGDIDAQAFEDGLAPETLVRWLPLPDLWAFWRGGKLSKQAIGKALTMGYDLSMFDARWFLDTLQGRSGEIKGTDVLAEGLSKDELTAWIRRVHETRDGSPKGLVTALGWDTIVAKTSNEALVAALDAMAASVGLTAPGAGGLAGNKLDPGARAFGSEEAPSVSVGTAGVESGEGWSDTSPDAAAVPAQQGAAPGVTEEGINIVLEEELIVAEDSGPSRPQQQQQPQSLRERLRPFAKGRG